MGGTRSLKEEGTCISQANMRTKCLLALLWCRKYNLILNPDQSVQCLECPKLH